MEAEPYRDGESERLDVKCRLYRDEGWDAAHALCCLDARHDGAHEFTPESEIVLAFA
jgi:hypothetical protein